MRQLTFSLPEIWFKLLKEIAKKKGISVSELCRNIIITHLNEAKVSKRLLPKERNINE